MFCISEMMIITEAPAEWKWKRRMVSFLKLFKKTAAFQSFPYAALNLPNPDIQSLIPDSADFPVNLG